MKEYDVKLNLKPQFIKVKATKFGKEDAIGTAIDVFLNSELSTDMISDVEVSDE